MNSTENVAEEENLETTSAGEIKQNLERQDEKLPAEKPEKAPEADESVFRFLQESKRYLSEELRFRRLRLLESGLFIDQSALEALEKGYRDWFTALAAVDPAISLPTEEKLHKKLFGSLLKDSKYLLDGKVLLFGRLLSFSGNTLITSDIPRFRGSLLDATTYIHMRDPILSETEGVAANIGSRGLIVEFLTRKIPLRVDNAKLQKLARVLQQSRSLPKKFANVQYAARYAVPAFADIWRQADLIPNNSPLLIPDSCRKAENPWYLIFGDLVFVHATSGELIDCYGLRGKNLHELLISECDALRRLERRPRFGSMTLAPRGRWYGSVKLEGDSYLLDPLVVKKFIERLPYAKDLPGHRNPDPRSSDRWQHERSPRHERSGKLPSRFTLSEALKGAVALIESTSWVDTVHVPRSFLQEYPKGTNFRSKGPWYIAINQKREILGLFDKNDPTNVSGNEQRTPSKKSPRMERPYTPLVGFGSPPRKRRRRKKGRNPKALEGGTQNPSEKSRPSITPRKEESSS